ncbi:MarR family winged helix-turn-helix transcriptional regulator [Dactylosporangium sp. NPDC051541]|uniref:MarR family winged helix-turn-helix transcriptional regulator n=1 Tax=Dactylosporangium sp. NPDC051541 TaxID=3363977 RepID=UPI0037AD4EB5
MTDHLIDLLRRFNVEADRFVEVFARGHGLHRTDMNAIAHIWRAAEERQPLTPGELARRLSLSPAATTALLVRLEQKGHVERRPDPTDRRRTQLHIQEKARVLAAEFFAPLGVHMREAFSHFTPAEISVVEKVIDAALKATARAADEANPVTSEGAALRP